MKTKHTPEEKFELQLRFHFQEQKRNKVIPKDMTLKQFRTSKENKLDKSPLCQQCDVKMVEGIALENTLVAGLPDFPGMDVHSKGQTVHYGGPGKIIKVWKCPQCGHSITKT